MTRKPFRPPYGLFIAIVVTLAIGLVTNKLLPTITTEAQRNKNVLLSAVPFIFIFVAILLTFIALINMSSRLLNDRIPAKLHGIVEKLLILGIVLGVVGMFQPWLLIIYKYGFMVLFISTLGFIWWSHIHPKKLSRQKGVIVEAGQESTPAGS